MIAFVVALKTELDPLLLDVKIKEEKFISNKKIYIGTLYNKDVVIALSDIGKVNASLTAQMVIDNFKPSLLINFGSTGGLSNRVSALSYFIIEKCCQFDFDLSKLDNVPVGYIQGYNKVYFPLKKDVFSFLDSATLGSSDRFICTQTDFDLIDKMNCDVFDMEGGAIAQVCESNGVPFASLKGVTDVSGSGLNSEQFVKNLTTVCNGFPKLIEKAFLNIK